MLVFTLFLIEIFIVISNSQIVEGQMMSHDGEMSHDDNNLPQNKKAEENQPPLKQIRQGIFLSEVECRSGQVLLIDSKMNNSVCVSPQTAKKLITRSWGTTSTKLLLSEDNEIKVDKLVEKIMTECERDVYCAINSLKNMTSVEKKFIVLRTSGDIASIYQSKGVCHGFGHHLGMFLYDYVDNLSESLFYANQLCGGSQYHGIIERFFEKNLVGTEPKKLNITAICPESFDNPYSLERLECVHGIGHGLTKFYNYDVFSALKECDELSSEGEEILCSKGIFMENVETFLESKEGNFDETDIFFPCDAVDPKYAPACYHFHTSYIRSQPNYSLEYAFGLCDMIEPEEFVKYCYYGMGRIYTGNSANDFEKAITVCKTGDANYQKYCFAGIQLTLVDNYSMDKGFEFCKFLPLEFKENCYDGIGKWIIMLHSSQEQREIECSKAESVEYSKVCINASLDNIDFL